MANITNNADDLERHTAHCHHETFAEWLFVRQNLVNKLLTNQDHLRTLSHLLLGEVPSAQQRNAKRVEVVLINPTKVSAESLGHRSDWPAFDRKWHVIELTAHRQLCDEPDS